MRIASPDQARPAPLEAGQPGVFEWVTYRGSLVAVGRMIGDRYKIHWFNIASYHFDPSDPTVAVFPCTGADLHEVRDRFFRSVTPLWLHVRGQSVLHASAVKMPAGVVALSAPPNTGKSTLAFALSRRGYPLWADDAIPFRLMVDGALAEPLPFFPRLRAPSAEHFGVDLRKVHRQEAWATLASQPPEPLLAIYLLERLDELENGPVVLSRLPASEAFGAVLAQTLSFGLQEPDLRRETMRQHLALMDLVPVYRLRFQTGLEQIPAILDTSEQSVQPLHPVS